MRIYSINNVCPTKNVSIGQKHSNPSFNGVPAAKTTAGKVAGATIISSVIGFFKGIKELFSSDNVPDDIPYTKSVDEDMIEYYSRVMG